MDCGLVESTIESELNLRANVELKEAYKKAASGSSSKSM